MIKAFIQRWKSNEEGDHEVDRFHEMINMTYLEYKSSVGYTNDEIISKMFSLKGVLEPYSSNENMNFLKRAGFKDMTIIYKNLCFEGILAIK